MYLKYFGFREFPFSVTPDPKFFYESSHHREAWASLYYGIKEKKGFIVVTGEVGTGKTTLIRKVLRGLDAIHHSVFIFNTLLTFDELFETIMRDLGLEPAGVGRVERLGRLNEFLLDKVKAGHVVSVMIDEAQHLSEDVLEGVRLLSNMETDRQKLLQIVLAGQPELDAKLNRPSLRQLKQRVSLWCRLERLSRPDTGAYIRHRLQVAQYQGPEIFPEPAAQLIWQHTTGIPRLINVVCDNALLAAFATSTKTVTPDIIREVVHDLQIRPEIHDAGYGAPEREDMTQFARSNNLGETDRGGALTGSKSRFAEEQGPGGLAQNAGTSAAGFAPIPPGYQREGEATQAPESRQPRHQAVRGGSRIPEPNDKKGAESGRVIDISDIPRPSRTVSAKTDTFVRPSRKAVSGRDDGFLPPACIDTLVVALTEAMGPMAPLVIRGQAAALGENLERFPQSKLRDLIEGIKGEILSSALLRTFEERIAKDLARYPATSNWRYSAS